MNPQRQPRSARQTTADHSSTDHDDLLIRPIGETDWATLKQLRLRALQEDHHAFGSSYPREAAFDEHRWRRRAAGRDGVPSQTFIAQRNQRHVGLVTALHHPAGEPTDETPANTQPPREPHTAELVSLWVAHDARRRGVGDALVHAVLHWAAAHRFRAIRLCVHHDNLHALRLYERCGFGVVARGAGEHERDLVMERRWESRRHA